MTDPRTRALLLPMAIGLALFPALVAWDAPPEPATGRRVAVERAARTGVGSCSAFACHGGNAPDGDLRSAYTTWMARDPHSRAGSVLSGELSADIEARLAGRSARPPIQAEGDPRCLGCHATQAVAGASGGPVATRREGVGCESCHGPAGIWIGPHTFPTWKSLSAEQKSALGMTRTKDLVARAALCAGCHVGGPGRDVDHDLIAAGHPRLNFELVSYLDALPKHWDGARELRAGPAFEARAWAIGQAVCAREALGLLAGRARAAAEHAGLWPEFSEYACASCHRGLTGALDPSAAGRSAASRGSPPWGTWYYAMAAVLAGDGADTAETATLARLRRLMEGANPSPAEADPLAVQARAELDRWLSLEVKGSPRDRQSVRGLLDRITEAGLGPGPPCWDRAAQLTLAASALGRSLERLGQPRTPERRSALEEMIRQVELPHVGGGPEAAEDRSLAGFRRAFERFKE